MIIAGLSIESDWLSKMFRIWYHSCLECRGFKQVLFIFVQRKNVLHTHIRLEIYFNATTKHFKHAARKFQFFNSKKNDLISTVSRENYIPGNRQKFREALTQ